MIKKEIVFDYNDSNVKGVEPVGIVLLCDFVRPSI